MRQKSLALLVGLLVAVLFAPSVLAELQSPQKRVITLSVLPPGAKSDLRVTALEDGTASVGIPDLGQFTFAPAFQKGDAKTVVVTVFDASTKPGTELGKVNLSVDGKPVQSKTKPSFEMHVISVK